MRRDDSGFSLTEMMVVVVIMSVLASVAYFSLTNYMRKARAAEVPRMFGEFRTKEEAYHAEFGQYLSTATEGSYFPSTLVEGRTAISGLTPASWNTLRISPGENFLYCQYAAIAGAGGSTTGMGPVGLGLWGGVAPRNNWFYLMARCDWDSGNAENSKYVQRGDQTVLYKENEGS